MAILERIVHEGDPQPPLHYWTLQMWTRVFGDSEKMLRFPSVLFSIIVVALMYKFGVVSVSRSTGIGAAILTAVHPFQIWLAQDVRNMYQMAIMFVLIATLNVPGVMRGRWRSWWIYIISGSLAMYSHYYALFGLLAHGIYMLGYRGQYWHRWCSAIASIVLFLLPWAVVIIPVFSSGQLADPSYMAIGDFLVLVAKDFALGPVVPDGVSTWAALIVVLLFLGGATHIYRNGKHLWGAILVVWPLIALAGIYTILLRRSTFNSFYFLMAFPAMYVTLAASWQVFFDRVELRRLSAVFVLVITGLIGYGLRNHYFVPEWSKNRGLREAASILKSELNPGDIFISNFPDPAQDYYFNDVIQHCTTCPAIQRAPVSRQWKMESTGGRGAGISMPSGAVTVPIYRFTEFVIQERAHGNKDGYELLYAASTVPGMSGGPIIGYREFGKINQGKCDFSGIALLAIHGRSEKYHSGGRSGLSLGVPVDLIKDYLVSNSERLGIPVNQNDIESTLSSQYCS